MDGFINVNKAAGLTSFAVVKKLRRMLPATKLGHLGTLDPMAEGVLPIAAGYATRLIEYISDQNKTYIAVMTLGGISDTQDAWGNIVYQPEINFDKDQLQTILPRYMGQISQIPPMFSAVHHQGERLYDLARQGITVERQARQITIDYLQVLSVDQDNENRPRIKIEVACSKGTYIRTLCHDIGQELGTGAYLTSLVRTRAGVFDIDHSYTLSEIEQNLDNLSALIKPVQFALPDLKKIVIGPELVVKIGNGNAVVINTLTYSGLAGLYDEQGNLLAIAESQVRETGSTIKPLKVFKTIK